MITDETDTERAAREFREQLRTILPDDESDKIESMREGERIAADILNRDFGEKLAVVDAAAMKRRDLIAEANAEYGSRALRDARPEQRLTEHGIVAGMDLGAQKDNGGELRARRAEKNRNGKLWQPVDALRDVIREIESGRLKDVDQLLIIHRRPDGNDSYTCGYTQAGLTFEEHLALLEIHKFIVMHNRFSG